MNKLFKTSITPEIEKILKTVCAQDDLKQFYLAGGTALALQIGHRRSYDLDFFSDKEFSANLIEKFPFKYQAINISNNSIELIVNNIKVMFMYFAYPLIKKCNQIEGIKLADPIYIGLMKLLALQGRTTKKDIYDLFFIDKKVLKLENLLVLYNKTYPKDKFNKYSSFKTLLDTSELRLQPDPVLLENIPWKKAYARVASALKDEIKNEAGIN
jgi:hypothetical protein